MNSLRYPSDWDKRRRYVYKRHNYTCRHCGQKGGPHGNTELQAHHRLPISQGGSHELDNLVTLCPECHNAQHSHDLNRDKNTTDNHGSGARIRPGKQTGSGSRQSQTATRNVAPDKTQNSGSESRSTGLVGTLVFLLVYHIALPVSGVLAYLYLLSIVAESLAAFYTLIFAGAVIGFVVVAGSIGSRFPYAVIKGYGVVGALVLLGGPSTDTILSGATGASTLETVGAVFMILFVFLGPLVIATVFGLFDSSLLDKVSDRNSSL